MRLFRVLRVLRFFRLLPLLAIGGAVVLVVAPARADDAERFRDLVKEATAAFGKGEFQRAIELCDEAYAIKPNPRLLYNRARAEEALGRAEPAIQDYELYLEHEPEAEDRAIVAGRIKALSAQLAEQERLAGERAQSTGDHVRAKAHYTRYLELAPRALDRREIEERLAAMDRPARQERAPLRPTPGRKPATGPGAGPWITLSIGGVALSGGGVLAVLSRQTYEDAKHASSGQRAASLRGDADRLTTSANVGFIVGGVLAISGLTWLLLSSSSAEKSAPGAYGVGQ